MWHDLTPGFKKIQRKFPNRCTPTRNGGGFQEGEEEYGAGREVCERISLPYILRPVSFLSFTTHKLLFPVRAPLPCVKCKIEEHPSERGPFIPGWLNNLEVAWVIAQVRFHSLTWGKSFKSCRCLGWDARNWRRYELSFKALCTKIE